MVWIAGYISLEDSEGMTNVRLFVQALAELLARGSWRHRVDHV
jgi:hypothetical protein